MRRRGPTRPKPTDLSPEQESVLRREHAKHMQESMRRLSGHVASGALGSFSYHYSLANGLSMQLRASPGHSLGEVVDDAISLNGHIYLKEPPKL